jgi:hypothetical protein
MFRHDIVLDICLNDLYHLAPLVPLYPPSQSLQGVRVLIQTIHLDLPSGRLTGTHHFGQDQALTRSHVIADDDAVFLEGFQGRAEGQLVFIVLDCVELEDVVDLGVQVIDIGL